MEYLIEKFDPQMATKSLKDQYFQLKEQFKQEVAYFDTKRLKEKSLEQYSQEELYEYRQDESQRQLLIGALIQKQNSTILMKNYEIKRKRQIDNTKKMSISDIRDKKSLIQLNTNVDLDKIDDLLVKNYKNNLFMENDEQDFQNNLKEMLINNVKSQARQIIKVDKEIQYEIPEQYIKLQHFQQEKEQQNKEVLSNDLKEIEQKIKYYLENTQQIYYSSQEIQNKIMNLNQLNFKMAAENDKKIKDMQMKLQFRQKELSDKLASESREKLMKRSQIKIEQQEQEEDQLPISNIDDANKDLQIKIEQLKQDLLEQVQKRKKYLFSNSIKLQNLNNDQNFKNYTQQIKNYLQKNQIQIYESDNDYDDDSDDKSQKKKLISTKDKKSVEQLKFEQYMIQKSFKKQQKQLDQQQLQEKYILYYKNKKHINLNFNFMKDLKNFKENFVDKNFMNFQKKITNYSKLMNKIRKYSDEFDLQLQQITNYQQIEKYYEDWCILQYLELKNLNPDLRIQFINRSINFYELYLQNNQINQEVKKKQIEQQNLQKKKIQKFVDIKKNKIDEEIQILADAFQKQIIKTKIKNKIPLKMQNCLDRLPILKINIINIL